MTKTVVLKITCAGEDEIARNKIDSFLEALRTGNFDVLKSFNDLTIETWDNVKSVSVS